MQGPYPLNEKAVFEEVTHYSPGVYILSRTFENANFVGRSDDDIHSKLKWWANIKGEYNYFWYEYCDSLKEAFLKECHLFHTYEHLDNPAHPVKPEEVNWQCPDCGIFQ